MGESRTALVAWVNELLGSNVQKVEEFGKGWVYCGIIDSIYGNVPMNKVKANAKSEYEYINNFKVLQAAFLANDIDKIVPVDQLVKCKMQENLLFAQWIKKYWDNHYHGQGYDTGRLGSQTQYSAPAAATRAPVRSAAPASVGRAGGAAVARTAPGAAAQNNNALIAQHRAQMEELQAHQEGLEKERDFYFSKLRDIEQIVQARLGEPKENLASGEEGILTKIQEILYSTEEGFEVPEAEAGADDLIHGESSLEQHHVEDDEETY